MHRCPYDGCTYKNLQKSNVTTHIRTQSVLLPPPFVSRRVALNQNSTGQKILCPTCGFATTDPGSLTRHRKRRHGYNPKTRQDHPERSTSKPNKSSSRHEPYKRDRPHALYCGTIDIAPSDSQTSLDSLFLTLPPNLESSSSSSSHNLDDILFPAFPS